MTRPPCHATDRERQRRALSVVVFLDVARPRPLLRVLDRVPGHPDVVPGDRQLPGPAGEPTLQNYADLTTPEIASAYLTSIEISLVTAVIGGIFGFLLAYAVISGGLPGVLRSGTMTFSGVASNFAGVPLALAFTFTLGRLGFMTLFLQSDLARHLRGRFHALLEARASRSSISTSSSR